MESTAQRHTHIVRNPGVVNLGCVFRRIMWIQYYITELFSFIFSYTLSYFLHIYPTLYFYARSSAFVFLYISTYILFIL